MSTIGRDILSEHQFSQSLASFAAGMASQQEKALKEKDIKPGDYVATRIGGGEAPHFVL